MSKPLVLNGKTRNSKSKSKKPCKCLSCAQPWREKNEGLTILICGDEACYLNCDTCTDRPNCGAYVPVAAVV